MRHAQRADRPRARLAGPRPPVRLDAAAGVGEQDDAVHQGKDLAQAPAGERAPAAAVLGPAPVGPGLLCREQRRDHGRDGDGIHPQPGRRQGEARGRVHRRRDLSASAPAKPIAFRR